MKLYDIIKISVLITPSIFSLANPYKVILLPYAFTNFIYPNYVAVSLFIFNILHITVLGKHYYMDQSTFRRNIFFHIMWIISFILYFNNSININCLMLNLYIAETVDSGNPNEIHDYLAYLFICILMHNCRLLIQYGPFINMLCIYIMRQFLYYHQSPCMLFYQTLIISTFITWAQWPIVDYAMRQFLYYHDQSPCMAFYKTLMMFISVTWAHIPVNDIGYSVAYILMMVSFIQTPCDVNQNIIDKIEGYEYNSELQKTIKAQITLISITCIGDDLIIKSNLKSIKAITIYLNYLSEYKQINDFIAKINSIESIFRKLQCNELYLDFIKSMIHSPKHENGESKNLENYLKTKQDKSAKIKQCIEDVGGDWDKFSEAMYVQENCLSREEFCSIHRIIDDDGVDHKRKIDTIKKELEEYATENKKIIDQIKSQQIIEKYIKELIDACSILKEHITQGLYEDIIKKFCIDRATTGITQYIEKNSLESDYLKFCKLPWCSKNKTFLDKIERETNILEGKINMDMFCLWPNQYYEFYIEVLMFLKQNNHIVKLSYPKKYLTPYRNPGIKVLNEKAEIDLNK